MAELLGNRLPSQLEECFDQVADGRTLRIERLEIDLGAMSWAEFESGFVDRVASAVMTGIRSEGSHPGVERGGDGKLMAEGERLEAWVYFLRYGHLPWWFADARWSEISSLRELHAADPEQVIGAIERLSTDCPAALVRLARHAKGEDLAAVLGVKDAGESGEPFQALHVVATWLEGLKGGNDRLGGFLSHLKATERLSLDFRPIRSLQRMASDDLETLAQAHPMPQPRLADPDGSPGHEGTNHLPVFRRIDSDGISKHPATIGIPLLTAGLVLLNPFLTKLFRHLGWLNESGGMDPDFRWHAVQALQYLALGKCGLPEPTLVLEKTLCGIPLHEVAAFPVLDDAIRSECDHLLEAAIAHWSALGKTSVNGLRESFLARPGLLRFEGSRVCLTVEGRPYDMLLGRLPWSLGPVMFKWLNQPIQVRWRDES